MTSYNEINSTKAIYSNISLDDIRTHYTLWSEEGQKKWYVYKCKEKYALETFGKTFTYSSWIMMSPALFNQEGQKNNNHWPLFSHRTIAAINSKISERKKQLDEQQKQWDKESRELWYEVSVNSIDEKVKETNLNISIGSIIKKVSDILTSSQGDILSMINVVKNLKLESAFNFHKSTDKKKVVKSANDIDGIKVYILFDIKHDISNSQYRIKRLLRCSKKKIHIVGQYYIFKPKNKLAEEKCKNLLNCKINELLQRARYI